MAWVKCRLRRTIVLLWTVSLLPAAAGAGEFDVTPNLSLREEYNDNIFFSAEEKEGDFITTFLAGLEGSRRTERVNARLGAELGVLDYADHSDLDSVDQHYRGDAAINATPRLSLSVQGRFDRDSRADRDVETTGIVLDAVRRDRQLYGGSIGYVLDERTQAEASYLFARDDFATERFSDSRSHNLSLGIVRTLDPRTTGRLAFDLVDTRYPRSEVENFSLQVGADRRISEEWTVSGEGGVRHTRSEFSREVFDLDSFQIVAVEEKSREWGWVARASLGWRGIYNSARLSVGRDVDTVSGRAGAVERTSVSLAGDRRFTEDFVGTLAVDWFLNRTENDDASAQPTDETTWSVRPSLRWNLTRDVYLEGGYAFSNVDNREMDAEARRHLAFLRCSGRFPLFEN